MREHDPNLECAAASDVLPDLLHGRLAGDARARAARHVAACDACAAEFALLGDVRAAAWADAPPLDLDAIATAVAAATAPRRAAPTPLQLRAGGAAARRVPPPSRTVWRLRSASRALAATVLVAVGAAVLGHGAGSDAPVRRGAPAAAAAAAAEPGLGTRFDDLSDDELKAVVAAVDGADDALPSAEPAPAAPSVAETAGGG